MPRAIKSRNQEVPSIRQYYIDVIDSLPNIIYLLDKNCDLTGCNMNFLNLLGLKEKTEVIGTSPYKKLASFAHWSQERVEIFKHDDIDVILSGKPIYEAEEAPVFGFNDEIIYFLSTRIPLFDNQKNVIGMVGILTDNSKYKKMEEQLKKIKEQLQLSNTKEQPVVHKEFFQRETVVNNIDNNAKQTNVLMVEDNSIAQRATQALLMQLDCCVDVADSGDKAVSLFEPGKYDLVFMDIGLEDTSGYMVSKKIRQLEKGTQFHVPIIALTGYEADVVKYDCEDYSMEGALTKPLTSEQAKQIIQHYIHHIDIPVRGLKNTKPMD